ncbi:MAG TPA: MBL fold metallo-hydrolase, partial [Roseiflexaceae bacterium]|nr:MBL fold metallo-hydrolase [Roseiflexaceae bacterium]
MRELLAPVMRDDQLLANMHSADPDVLSLWWLGQSGFLLAWQGVFLLIDPYLSDSLTHKYAATPRPHIRMTAIPIQPERLDFVSAVTSSHNHTDHLDAETLLPLLAANPQLAIIVSAANRTFAAQRLDLPVERLIGITQQLAVTVGPFTLHAVPAAHEQREQDEEEHERYIGMLVQAGPHTIYHSGDTLRYEGMAELLRPWQIDLALLPINGRDPARGVAGNLTGAEAARLAPIAPNVTIKVP